MESRSKKKAFTESFETCLSFFFFLFYFVLFFLIYVESTKCTKWEMDSYDKANMELM